MSKGIERISQRVSVLAIMVTMSSCQRTRLEESLRLAGDNRSEIETVLKHYEGDTLKYKAAVFLIENMQGDYSLVGEALDSFYVRIDSAYRSEGDFLSYRRFLGRAVKGVDWIGLEKRYDLENIKAEYLIRNIDEAFEVRESRWCRDLTFEDFCEYILPYRVGNEELEDWRTDYRKTFGHVFENVDLSADSALWIVCDSLSRLYEAHNYVYPAGFPSQKPSMLRRILVGTCEDYANLFVLIGRAFGIPVARDYTPQWANYHSSHDWASVVLGDTSYSFSLGDRTRLGEHVGSFEDHFMTKVFRRTYRRVQTPIEGSVPSNIDFEHVRDVTSQFFETQEVNVRELYASITDNVLLTVFDNQNWTAVDCAHREGDSVTFRDVRRCKAVYLPAYYRAGKVRPAQRPFILLEDGGKQDLTPKHDEPMRVVLTRKYLDTRARHFTQTIVGGTFMFSNDSTFASSIKLSIPDSVGLNYQTMAVDSCGGEYQYFRYQPNRGQTGEVAEIEFYDSRGDSIRGKVIANYRPHRSVAPESAFDGETLSFASCPDTCWFGIDFGMAREISRVDYLAHTDDNFIREGEEYELFYWGDDEWVSVGKQTGSRKTQELIYDNVPKNALLLLKNNTKGKEERIFTYEGEHQVWW